jgi:acetyl-CoA C-acetyltransferase
MSDAVIVEAVRTPIGKRGGGLSHLHPTQALGFVQRAVLERCGVEPDAVGQVLGGCVTQVGEQSFNVARMAWLHAGLPYPVGVATLDCQCGSSQQAAHLISDMIAAGSIEIGIACGVEMMSRVEIGANTRGPGHPKPEGFPYELPSQFTGAERVAAKYGVTREQADTAGLRSQARAREARRAGRLAEEIAALPGDGGLAPGPEGRPVEHDEGIRASTAEGLGALAPIITGGVHTAGNTSQISDGASAMLLMSADRARERELRVRGRIRDHVLVGADPYLHIEGPIDATRALLRRSGLRSGDIDLFEINEAFASVVLAWQQVFEVGAERLNVNGGAIALGHPMGATGVRLLGAVLRELERRGGERALVAMCCGSAVATGTIVERV